MALLTFGVLAEERYLAQNQPAGLIAALSERGHAVRVIEPRQTLQRADDRSWIRGLDIVVARGRSWDLLTLLSAAESFGVPTVNRRDAVGAVHNKAEMAVRLASAGLPMPRTYIGTPAFLAATVPSSDFPLIVKPIFGDNSRGIHVFCSAAELGAVQEGEVMLGQQYLDNDGFDVKLYAIGEEVWTVRKPSPLASGATVAAELVPVRREGRDIARRCGALFGLELFGVDCVDTPRGLSVIEVNDYPNYSSVPGAGARIASHIESLLVGVWSVAAS